MYVQHTKVSSQVFWQYNRIYLWQWCVHEYDIVRIGSKILTMTVRMLLFKFYIVCFSFQIYPESNSSEWFARSHILISAIELRCRVWSVKIVNLTFKIVKLLKIDQSAYLCVSIPEMLLIFLFFFLHFFVLISIINCEISILLHLYVYIFYSRRIILFSRDKVTR